MHATCKLELHVNSFSCSFSFRLAQRMEIIAYFASHHRHGGVRGEGGGLLADCCSGCTGGTS
jgi:hypothetical protein